LSTQNHLFISQEKEFLSLLKICADIDTKEREIRLHQRSKNNSDADWISPKTGRYLANPVGQNQHAHRCPERDNNICGYAYFVI